ncbi:mycofactocin-coupled SDR family oxidoreductase [Sporichthya brevicatena]|uniref:Mycofactocin-coupled SDR family oxidoreductase n=1 Tax=Sporichthya brevicatena TaxID=171442 RepID=A0ABN1H4K1_9ACTN
MGILDGKVAFITGAARGQGRRHAIRMAAEGADILAVDLCEQYDTVPYAMSTDADLAETVREVEGLDRRIVAVKADVRDRSALAAAAEKGLAELGRLDIVVANAAIAPLELAPASPTRSWQDIIDTNLTGVFHTVEVSLPAMISGGNGGAIVLINSTAGLKGTLAMKTVGGYAYSASKHAMVGLMRAYATELAQHSIRVNTVHPAGVDTPMVVNPAMAELMANRDLSAWTNLLPVGRMSPDDISSAVLWLVSDAARYVTGVTLPVDAGFTTK